ncbi:MAG: D-alanine--D-alanine ligase [Melioribacteraceae bacterium]|nr:D-alanine--D-alanine ligase [Melioribacteraceae bacterium]MCF8264456.1 D-alanine--D-alanine ligase [Melioribacteraceae bacterium]
MASGKLKILLLVGGYSSEREVSKMSSISIYKALIELGYDVDLMDPAYGKNQPTESDLYFKKDYSHNEISNKNILNVLSSEALKKYDLIFIGLHGGAGEDGKVQSILDLAGKKYTGSGVLSSALAMDKYLSKLVLIQNGVPTPDWVYIADVKSAEKAFAEVKGKFGFPCVIKPNDGGSTVGLTICKNEDEFIRNVEFAFKYSPAVLVEEFIPGKELTVGILEDKSLPVLEIVPNSGFYDYEAKYESGNTQYLVPAPINDNVAVKIREAALLAFNSLCCEDYARIDFRLNEKGEFYCLEVNTLPGMTSHSLVPKMAKHIGISFNELIDKIVLSALND